MVGEWVEDEKIIVYMVEIGGIGVDRGMDLVEKGLRERINMDEDVGGGCRVWDRKFIIVGRKVECRFK